MKSGNKSLHYGLLAGAVLVLTAVQASAQFSSQTFDTTGSFQHDGNPNYNPPPIALRFDFGTFSASLNHTVGWDATHDNTGNGGGSAKISWAWDISDGSGAAAFTFDLNPDGTAVYTNLAFDLFLDPSSTVGTYQGNPSDYGYFQVVTRDGSYNYNGTTYAASLLNPGVWTHFNIPLTGVNQSVRAMTLQDYNDAFRNITGTETYYIDNLTLTQVPEPASLLLIGLAVPGLVLIGRRYRKSV
jgi:hypothetical protein